MKQLYGIWSKPCDGIANYTIICAEKGFSYS